MADLLSKLRMRTCSGAAYVLQETIQKRNSAFQPALETFAHTKNRTLMFFFRQCPIQQPGKRHRLHSVIHSKRHLSTR